MILWKNNYCFLLFEESCIKGQFFFTRWITYKGGGYISVYYLELQKKELSAKLFLFHETLAKLLGIEKELFNLIIDYF